MRKIPLMLISVILVSGCVSFGGAAAEFSLTPFERTTRVIGLDVSAEASPPSVLEDKQTVLFLDLENTGNTTLRDVNTELTDLCVFQREGGESTRTNLTLNVSDGQVRPFGGSGQTIELYKVSTDSLNESADINVRSREEGEPEEFLIQREGDVISHAGLRIEVLNLHDADPSSSSPDPGDGALLEVTLQSRTAGDLRPRATRTHEFNLRAGSVDLERQCDIRYRTSYEANTRLLSDIAVVSEDELTRLNRRGEESDLRIFRVETEGPVDADFEISKEQPIPADTTFFTHLQFTNEGRGDIDAIGVRDIKLDYPEDVVELTDAGCDDLRQEGVGDVNILKNGGEIDFRDKETKKITCKFRTRSGGIISEVGTFDLDVSYKYTLRDTLTVTVKPE